MRLMIVVFFVVALMGCGKSVDQIVKTGQALVGIAGEVYKDVRENVETAKKLVTEPASPTKGP